MADARRPGSLVVYRCHGCEFEFAVGSPGATPCPRCGCIGGHDRVDTVRNDPDARGGSSGIP